MHSSVNSNEFSLRLLRLIPGNGEPAVTVHVMLVMSDCSGSTHETTPRASVHIPLSRRAGGGQVDWGGGGSVQRVPPTYRSTDVYSHKCQGR